jgi:hypothetical protein
MVEIEIVLIIINIIISGLYPIIKMIGSIKKSKCCGGLIEMETREEDKV